MKNNLFTYATSELSQDAFICWLMSYAMKDARPDKALRRCAVAFIKEFIPELVGESDDEIAITNIERQHGKIDVLLTINDRYWVIIEDKTFTSDHDDQLQRYKDLLKREGIEPKSIYGIYYKIGFESDTSNAEAAGYAVFDRKRILSILDANKNGISSDIFTDYLDFYTAFEADVQKYKTLPVGKWDWKMVQGFFDDLKHDPDFSRGVLDGDMNYDYVANPSGGFYGMWIFPHNSLAFKSVEYYPYLQMEFADGKINICFKLYIEELLADFKPSQLKDVIAYNNTNEWTYNLEHFGYFKPARLASGKTMTMGTIWKQPQLQLTYSDIRYAFQKAIDEFGSVIAYCRERTGAL